MIKIKINPNKKEEFKEPPLKLNLQIRKSLDGKLIITDHEDLDIVIDQDKKKIIIFSTDMKNSDKTYFTQDRFFKYFIKKGIVDPETVISGNIYGCLEGKILDPKDNVNPIDITLLTISKWIDEERPTFMYQKASKEEFIKDRTDPDEEDSTELGEIPHKTNKYGPGSETYYREPSDQKPYEE